MDICVLNPFFYPYHGGTEKVLLEIYRRLAKKHNVCVLSAAFGDNRRAEEKFGIRIIRLRSEYLDLPGLPMPWPVMRGLNEAVRREGADIYHINNRYLYYHRTLNAISERRAKLALTLHNALPRGINLFTDVGGLLYDLAWGRSIMERAGLIVSITRSVAETTVPKRFMRKTHIVFNGIDMGEFRPRHGKGMEEIGRIKESMGNDEIILNVARLTAQKGQVYLLRAYAELLKERKRSRLLIIGRGPLKAQLYRESERLGIRKRLTILSDVSEKMLPYYYNASSVFVLPSLYEPASISLLEALASGVPAVASRVGGVPEMMKDSGRYVRPRDIEGIRNSMEEALVGGKGTKAFVERGRGLMKREHDWDKIANEYEALFLKLAT